jgi:hypothetical protein
MARACDEASRPACCSLGEASEGSSVGRTDLLDDQCQVHRRKSPTA